MKVLRATVFLLGGAAAASYAYALFVLRGYTVDDAYITFRYAHNLARGWGLTFNQAPPRAEGYTSVLWTLLSAVPEALRLDTAACAKAFGVAAMLGTLALVAAAVARLGREHDRSERRLAAVFACALVLAFPCAPAHAVSGMETALAAFLAALVALLFVAAATNPRAEAALPVAGLALGLTRPEANLFVLGVLVAHVLLLPRARRKRFDLLCVIGYILPGAAYFAVRALYYGHAFPLPYYVKAAGAGFPGLRAVMSFTANSAIGTLVPVVFLFAARGKRPLFLLAAAGLLVLYFVRVDPIMGYGHRYFFPLVPVVAIVGGAGFLAACARGPRARAACAVGLAAACAVGFLGTRKVLPDYLAYERGLADAHGVLARQLRNVAWTGPASLAIGDAGLVPYATDLPTIDTFGLNEPAIVAPPKSERVAYVLGRRPTLLVLISREKGRFVAVLPHEDGLWRAATAAGYAARATYRFADDYWLWALWDPKARDAESIASALASGG